MKGAAATRAIRVCLVEDDAIMGESLSDRFRLEGIASLWCRDGAAAVRALRDQSFDIVVSDMRLGDMLGEEVFDWATATLPETPPFLFITGFGSIDQAVALIKRGASDYLTKPFDLDELIRKLRSIVAASGGQTGDDDALGVSPGMRRISASLPRIAAAASTVLVVGDSGVGKEHVARNLHAARYPSGKHPFVAVNCGAIAESLLEAELFGHEKGAFTGAARVRPGVFEQADAGTLFLDEIGEMPLAVQVRLLRVIQERVVTRVGGEAAIPVNLLLVCATHRDLKAMVADGHFREDLYYRVNVVQIKVPPLRERPEDILWFAELFLGDIARQRGGPRRRLHPQAERAMRAYPWPGNIRELRHTIERACIMSEAEVLPAQALFPDDLQAAGTDDAATLPAGDASLNDYLRDCERRYIVGALDGAHWQIAQTAERLGISRKNLWEKMKKLGIEAPGGS